MSAVGITAITAPELKSVMGEEILKFKLSYQAYLAKVEEFNTSRVQSQRVPPAGMKSCVQPELLSSMVMCNAFPSVSNIEEVTDEHVKTWIESRCRVPVNEMDQQVSDALRRVRFQPKSSDPEGAAFRFFTSITTELRRNRVSHVITDAPKAFIRQLIPKLEPKLLRDKMQSRIRYWTDEQKKDFSGFITEVTKTYVDVANYTEPGDREKSKDRSSKPQSHKSPRQNGADDNKTNMTTPRSASLSNEGSKKNNKKRKGEWTAKCLNPDCEEKHRIKECDITSEEDKKRFLKEYYEKIKKAKVSAIKRSELGDGRWNALINDSVDCVALGDYGADDSALPLKLLKEIQKKSVISIETFDKPIVLTPAINLMQEIVTASAKCRLNITVCLPCGPFRLRKVEFLVIDQDMDEVLLGRPLLKCLGFNLESHLESVRSKFDGADMSAIMQHNFNGGSLESNDPAKAASMTPYKGLWYDDVEEDPINLPESIGSNMGIDKEEDVQSAFKSVLKQARENGMTENGVSKIKQMLHEYREIFRIKLGSDPPASVDPMQIKLKPDHRPVRAKQRRYAPKQYAFIESTVRKLVNIGAVRPNAEARWASPALAVPKPGSQKFRFTVDLRAPNRETIPIASAMPNLDNLLHSTAGSRVFAKLDMCHAYWQIPLHENSQECMSIQTPLGVHTPSRVLQGSTDAGNHFQSVTAQIFSEIEKLLQWLDDFLLHAKDEDELLRNLCRFFELCRQFKLKLHAEKIELFLTKANFCGRVIDSNGVRFNPRNLDTLLKMKTPEFASDLQQFLCAANWMRTSIPEFSKTISPLHILLEECYNKVGKRTKRAVRKISLSGLWGTKQDSAFRQIQEYLAQAIQLAHPNPDYSMCLFTDASETHWASVLTQIPRGQTDKDIEDQDHQPLAFLSGSFTGPANNWSIVEKEAFSVVESMTRLDHFTAAGEVSLFTDHANLVYIFDPYGRNPGISRHTANKLMRWALKLSAYRYVIEHLPGERNVWADILTRWAVKPSNKVKSTKLSRLLYAPISPEQTEEYDWPTHQDISKAQQGTTEEPPNGFTVKDGVIQNSSAVFWIPQENELLRLRIMIAAHTGRGGHRGFKPTLDIIKQHFTWKTLSHDVDRFVRSCLHCLCTATGRTVPRPMGHSLHADKPNEIIHFDYCYIGKGDKGLVYVLILKDDFSSYVWLFPFESADALSTVEALMEWFSSFGVVLQWVSDQGSHFKNEVVAGLNEKLRGSHHFTLPYCPWTNGTVEVVCRELMRVLRALASEFQIPFKLWPSILPLVQSVLNSTPLTRLGRRCPLTAFTGLPADNPLRLIKTEIRGKVETIELNEVRARQLINVENLSQALDEMHRDVKTRSDKAREDQVSRHNRKTHVRKCNFDVGDYVLRAIAERSRPEKLSYKWKGPYRIKKVISDFLFEIEDLRTNKIATVHGTRLKFFRNKEFEVTSDCIEQLNFQDHEYCIADAILDIRIRNGEVELLVKWKGFDDEDPGWEKFDTMKEDIPGMVEDFVADIKSTGTPRQKRITKSC